MAIVYEGQEVRTRRWYHWYSPDDSLAERKLVMKLDLLLVPFALTGYWLRLTDASNLTTAYVAGMKTDLGFEGNQLVHFGTMYTLGAVLGQLPCAYLFPKVRMNWLIPGSLLGLAVFTLLEYRAETYAELMGYRFMIGLFEAAYFPGVHYVFGSWYRGDEINRRGGVFYIGVPLGSLTAGLLTAAASDNLDGVNGLAGWRWMFIITAAITFPVALLGFILWPGTPEKPQSLFLTKEEMALARKRLEKNGHELPKGFSWAMVVKIFKSWHVYVLTIWDILFWNASVGALQGGYVLWLSSLERYTKGQVNQLGSISPAIGIFIVLFVCFASDMIMSRPAIITLSCIVSIIGYIILVVWDVPDAALWFSFNTMYTGLAYSSVIYGWANDILKHNTEERAFVLIVMNAVAQSTTVWTPLLVFQTVEAPRFIKGYPFCLAISILFIACTWVVKWLHDRQEREYAARALQDSAFSHSRNAPLDVEVQEVVVVSKA